MNTAGTQALHNEAQSARFKLGADRNNRRFGGVQTPDRKDNRTKEQRRMDQITLEHETAVMLSPENRTLNIVEQAVQIAYATGGTQLNESERKALALVAFNMGLDPSPGVGHLYAWKQGSQFFVQIGYQGWIFKAQQKYQFVYEVREMNDKERAAHGLATGDIGAICDLYETSRAKQWREMGLEPRPVKGFGVLRATADATPPKGRTKLWVAMKRATTDALKHLGLGFGPMLIQPVDGMNYDPEIESYVSVSGGELDADPEMVGTMQGDFEEGVIDATPETEPVTSTASINALKTQIANTPASGKYIDTEKYVPLFADYCKDSEARAFTLLLTKQAALSMVDRKHGDLIYKWAQNTQNAGDVIKAFLAENQPAKAKGADDQPESTPAEPAVSETESEAVNG